MDSTDSTVQLTAAIVALRSYVDIPYVALPVRILGPRGTHFSHYFRTIILGVLRIPHGRKEVGSTLTCIDNEVTRIDGIRYPTRTQLQRK